MGNVVYVATSLDGYIARPNGALDWLEAVPTLPNEDYGYAEFMNSVDAVVMGRKTFEVVAAFETWPYAKPVLVLSRTLEKGPRANHVEVVNDEPEALVQKLAGRGLHQLYIDGGQTIQSFLRRELIDEMIITRVPVLLGAGIPLFGELGKEIKWQHIQTTAYENGLVKSQYKVVY